MLDQMQITMEPGLASLEQRIAQFLLINIDEFIDLLHDYKEDHVEQDELDAYDIELGPDMPWDDCEDIPGVDLGVRFCRPYPKADFDSIWEKARPSVKRARSKENVEPLLLFHIFCHGHKFSFRRLSYRAQKLSLYLCGLYALLDFGTPIWSTEWPDHSVYKLRRSELVTGYMDWFMLRAIPQQFSQHEPDQSEPLADERPRKSHMAGMVACDASPDEHRLRRGELISALSLMRDHMAQPQQFGHQVHPVILYSFCGMKVRVLQVHFDAVLSKLIVRKTSYLSIKGEADETNIKLVLRWISNIPIGDTRLGSITGIVENGPCQRLGDKEESLKLSMKSQSTLAQSPSPMLCSLENTTIAAY